MRTFFFLLVLVSIAMPAAAQQLAVPSCAQHGDILLCDPVVEGWIPPSLSVPAPRRPDNLFRAGLVAGVATSGMDLSITSWCLGQGTCREGNPLMQPLVSHPLVFGAARIGLVGVAFWMLAEAHDHGHPILARTLVWTVAAGYAYVSVRNAQIVGAHVRH